MFGLNKDIFLIALTASIVSVILAIIPGIINFLETGSFSRYNPNLAVLTITLLAIIWYTAFTSQSILIERNRDKAKTTSLSTAILGELSVQFLKYEKFSKISKIDRYSPKKDSFELPVLENIIKSDISYLPSSVTESIPTFYYENIRFISELNKDLDESKRHELRGDAADLANHVCEIVEKLEEIGGFFPEKRKKLDRIPGGAVSYRDFPDNPFIETKQSNSC